MKRSLLHMLAGLLALLFAGCMSTALAPPTVVPTPPPRLVGAPLLFTTPGGLMQVMIDTTAWQPEITCDGVVRTQSWTVPTAATITAVHLWIGVDARPSPLIDVWSTAMLDTGFVLGFLGLDHYASFTGPHQLDKACTACPTVVAGQSIRLQHQCTNYDKGTSDPHSASHAIIDFVEAR